MIKFQRILFPVDLSARSASAAPSVRAMAERFDAELTVLHVVDLPVTAVVGPPEQAAWAALIGAEGLREQGRVELERFVAREFPDTRVKVQSDEGDPATLIVEYARESAADLIMMPTSGHGRFRRLLLGSVTAKVLHDTDVPVWTGVHAEELAAHPPNQWKRAVCALDDDPRDLPTLQWAKEFACDQKLELWLAHGVPGAEGCEGSPSLQEFLLNVARGRMGELQAQAGTNFEVCVEGDSVARVVHQAAIAHSADILIAGRGVIQKRFGRLRSSAYQIIREAPCPVISVCASHQNA